ncbi:cell death abnormality protein 1-like [Haliotis cracherodii]|uniref:cell death abnormality protein 1-like n=1 Tax=Haliotis cracherodii TaxID=6455 RepID=UPI0039E76B69
MMTVQPSYSVVTLIVILLHSSKAQNDPSSPGGTCKEGCKQGFYGDGCNRSCRNQCISSRCHVSRDTGSAVCDTGCIPGFRGRYCERKCPRRCAECTNTMCPKCTSDSWYGANCSKYCSHCNGESCFKNGNCKRGCTGGNVGPGCNTTPTCSFRCSECEGSSDTCSTCKPGYYGNSCVSNCSSNCIGSVCHFSNGTCAQGCISGWVGHDCTVQLLVDDTHTAEPEHGETIHDGVYGTEEGEGDKTFYMLIIFGSLTVFMLVVSCIVGVSLWHSKESRRTTHHARTITSGNTNHASSQLGGGRDAQSYLTATHDISHIEAHIYDEIPECHERLQLKTEPYTVESV